MFLSFIVTTPCEAFVLIARDIFEYTALVSMLNFISSSIL